MRRAHSAGARARVRTAGGRRRARERTTVAGEPGALALAAGGARGRGAGRAGAIEKALPPASTLRGAPARAVRRAKGRGDGRRTPEPRGPHRVPKAQGECRDRRRPRPPCPRAPLRPVPRQSGRAGAWGAQGPGPGVLAAGPCASPQRSRNETKTGILPRFTGGSRRGQKARKTGEEGVSTR